MLAEGEPRHQGSRHPRPASAPALALRRPHNSVTCAGKTRCHPTGGHAEGLGEGHRWHVHQRLLVLPRHVPPQRNRADPCAPLPRQRSRPAFKGAALAMDGFAAAGPGLDAALDGPSAEAWHANSPPLCCRGLVACWALAVACVHDTVCPMYAGLFVTTPMANLAPRHEALMPKGRHGQIRHSSCLDIYHVSLHTICQVIRRVYRTPYVIEMIEIYFLLFLDKR
jgi:hypothetical protein